MRAQNYRVESICRVLTEHGVQVTPRTYRNWKSAPPSARTISDAYFTDALRGTVGAPGELYVAARCIATCAGRATAPLPARSTD
jgi:putative transposase